MKTTIYGKMGLAILTLVMAAGIGSARAKDAPVDKEVDIGISEAFVPGSFDANSDVNVVVSGVYPNGCYRWSRAVIDSKEEAIEVTTKAKVRSGMCLMVLVPYSNQVNLGKLSVGEHTVRFVGGDGTYLEKKVVVEAP